MASSTNSELTLSTTSESTSDLTSSTESASSTTSDSTSSASSDSSITSPTSSSSASDIISTSSSQITSSTSSATTSSTTSESISSTISESTSSSASTVSTSIDQCSVGLLDATGVPDLALRMNDCSILNVVTVTPPEVTQSTTEVVFTSTNFTTITTTVTTTSPSPTSSVEPLRKRDGGVTATGLDGTVTVKPTQIPTYATYCDSYESYYDACSDLGITASTTTAAVQTSFIVSTEVITCFMSSVFTVYLGIPFPTFGSSTTTTEI
ncbi:hypothetical protein BX600DRAFT_461083 [Xylariales sp. PMI_506]|nr:hypothetical protein BX600DRAFT_461083 [Xylariales sp. PMI_506]